LHTTKLLKDYSQDFALTEQTNSYKNSPILKLSNNSIFNIVLSLGQRHHQICFEVSMNDSKSWYNSKHARAMHVLMN
jgi:hypothetical protein